MEQEDKICYCFHVTKRKITNYIRVHKPRVPSQLSECGGAGTGCGWCVAYLKQCFKRAYTEDENAVMLDGLTPEEYAQQRANYIREGHGVPAANAEPLPPNED